MKALSLTMAMLNAVQAFPSITVKENGADKKLWVVDNGLKSKSSGAEIQIVHDGRSYLATKDGDKLAADMYYTPNLLGGSIAYDMDLHESDCSCNAALYLVSMPGKDWNGNPSPSQGNDYYCDANKVGGNWCPEMDIMEANKYAWHTTMHKCDAPNDKGHYSNCDRGGNCMIEFHQRNPQAYGPGGNYKINTNEKFNIKLEFKASGESLEAVHVTLKQGASTVEFNAADAECAGGYLDAVKGPIEDGMAIAMSNWGSDWNTMKWLDQDTGCQGSCADPTIKISNLEFVTGGAAPVPPTPTPTPHPAAGTYSCWNGKCSLATAGKGFGDCMTECTAPYDFGPACSSPHDQECPMVGCTSCNWSWPRTDPKKWASKDATCRCKAWESDKEMYWSQI